jgi:hypothetical protein
LNSLYLIPQQNSNTEYNKHSPLGGSHLKMFSRKAPFKDGFPGITVFRLFSQKQHHSEHFESCRHPHPKMQFSTASSPIPAAVGMTAAAAVHPILPVSFFIVSSVVLHGECIKVNSTAETAVIAVQPLPESTSERAAYELISVRQLPEVYAISIIGITSSFAGSPKMNAASITPSSPISLAAGSSHEQNHESSVSPPALIFASA